MIYLLHNSDLLENTVPSEDELYKTAVGTLSEARTCEIRQEKNGLFTLSMTYPAKGENASDLIKGNAIAAPMAGYALLQIFIITQSDFFEDSEGGWFTVTADHISYNAEYVVAAPFNYPASTSSSSQTSNWQGLRAALSAAVGKISNQKGSIGYGGNGTVTVNRAAYSAPVSLRQAMLDAVDGVEGSYFKPDNLAMELYSVDTAAKSFELVYGRNILEFETAQVDNGFYTHIMPYMIKNIEQTDGNGDKVTVPTFCSTYNIYKRHNVDALLGGFFTGVKRIKAVDFTGKYSLNDSVDLAALDDAAPIWLDENPFELYPNDISVKALPDDDNEFFLGAYGTISYPPMGIELSAAITSLTYDVLADRVTTIGVGEIRRGITETVARIAAGKGR